MGRHKGKKGKAARNAMAKQSADANEEAYSKAPHSFVFQRGKVGKTVKELVKDVRKILEPFTAANLKVRRKSVMKDFLTVAGPLNVSHFIVFTKTEIGVYMKLICVPRGPTLTFKVNEFSLARDVLSFQKHPDVDSKMFINHSVMVTNLPSDNMENKLMNVTFKNMFPSINPNTVKINDMRRSVLVNYDPETKCVDVRHYTMKVVPTGVSRTVKKLMRPKLPNLGGHNDIADVFLGTNMSDSEGEQDGPHNQVTVTQKVRDRGVAKNAVNAIRLKEIGPRLTLQLVKIEEGFESGNVLYHSLIKKTAEELEALRERRQNTEKVKLARKQRQEANVAKKKVAKEQQIKKTLEGMNKKRQQEMKNKDTDGGGDDDSKDADIKINEDSDDDAEYYKQEVGQEPEPEMFSKTRKRKRTEDDKAGPETKRRRPGFIAKRFSSREKSQNKFSGRESSQNKFSSREKGQNKFSSRESSQKKFSSREKGQKKFSSQEKSQKKFSAKFSHKPNRGSKVKKNVAGIKNMKKHKF